MAVLPHLLLRIAGTLHSSDQTWSIGFRFRSETGGDPAAIAGIQNKLESWRDAVRALNNTNVFPSDILAVMGGATAITAVRAAAVGADGKETAVAIVEGSPLAIGTTATKMPSQVAMCFSLDSGKPGASNRGRVYLPALGYSITAAGRLALGDLQGLSQEMAAFLRAVENAGATAITPGVQAVVISQTKGTATPITSVRLGDRLDIQRRRADKEKETYGVAVIPQ